MFERALETLDHTPHRTRCWRATYYARTFMTMPLTRLQTAENRYIVLHSHIEAVPLCIFRAWTTDKPLRNEIYAVQFRDEETYWMDFV